jgi:site-specific DNA-methyltransferase (adenine-specific)
VSKAIDKAAGATRDVIGPSARHVSGKPEQRTEGLIGSSTFAESVGMGAFVTAPATEDARTWSGWGTALKPAREPIIVARKPLAGTVAANVLEHGTGALHIDACRVEGVPPSKPQPRLGAKQSGGVYGFGTGEGRNGDMSSAAGRWPSNVVLSHAPECDEACLPGCPVAELGEQSKFFPVFRYQAKAPTRERPKVDGVAHPTVKPLELMRWLVRLVTPPGGLVLDPFAGSGTTVQACEAEGFRCIAIEREAQYLPLIQARMRGAA